jgi:hypothetical protein
MPPAWGDEQYLAFFENHFYSVVGYILEERKDLYIG